MRTGKLGMASILLNLGTQANSNLPQRVVLQVDS
jgi:hypothetical protein